MWKGKSFYLEMNPVDTVSDVLEHALVGHEKVTIFEASLTTNGDSEIHDNTGVYT